MFDYLNFGPTAWITLYIVVWIISVIWTVVMSYLVYNNPKLIKLSDSGISILGLTGGALAVGLVSIGLNANPDVFIILVLALGCGGIGLTYVKLGEIVSNKIATKK